MINIYALECGGLWTLSYEVVYVYISTSDQVFCIPNWAYIIFYHLKLNVSGICHLEEVDSHFISSQK